MDMVYKIKRNLKYKKKINKKKNPQKIKKTLLSNIINILLLLMKLSPNLKASIVKDKELVILKLTLIEIIYLFLDQKMSNKKNFNLQSPKTKKSFL
jgi:hypothetical protein